MKEEIQALLNKQYDEEELVVHLQELFDQAVSRAVEEKVREIVKKLWELFDNEASRYNNKGIGIQPIEDGRKEMFLLALRNKIDEILSSLNTKEYEKSSQ